MPKLIKSHTGRGRTAAGPSAHGASNERRSGQPKLSGKQLRPKIRENQFLRAAGRGADRRGPWRESDERRSGQPKLSEKQLNAKKK